MGSIRLGSTRTARRSATNAARTSRVSRSAERCSSFSPNIRMSGMAAWCFHDEHLKHQLLNLPHCLVRLQFVLSDTARYGKFHMGDDYYVAVSTKARQVS